MKTIITEEMRVRQRAVEYAIKYDNNSKSARKYHTSRQQIKRWRDKYDGTVGSLANKSRRPKSHPNQHTNEELDLLKTKYKKFKIDGLAQVYVEAKKLGYSRSYYSMCKRIRLMNMKPSIVKKSYPKSNWKAYKTTYPGEKVQIDIKYVPIESILFGPLDKRYYQITAIDEYTRKRVLRIVDEKSVTHTANFLETLEDEMGFKIKTVQTDNGREFVNETLEKESMFEIKLKELNIEYKRTRPYSPWQNGKVERSHRLDSEFYSRKKFLSYEEMIKSVKKNCSRYNNTARKVLEFKTPNMVLKEYKERVQYTKKSNKRDLFIFF